MRRTLGCPGCCSLSLGAHCYFKETFCCDHGHQTSLLAVKLWNTGQVYLELPVLLLTHHEQYPTRRVHLQPKAESGVEEKLTLGVLKQAKGRACVKVVFLQMK